jgi:PAS domain S-box-containing protein
MPRRSQASGHDEPRYRAYEQLPPDLLDSLVEGCQVIGRDWTYLYLNEAAARQGRRPREELLGHTMQECYPNIERSAMFAVLRRAMEERIVLRMENEFTYPDGSSRCFELRFAPVPDGVFILSLDVTDWKHAQDDWLRLSTAIDQAGEAVLFTSRQGEIQHVNPAFERITGYRRVEVLGKNPRILAGGRHDPAFYHGLWEALTAGDTWRGQFINRRKNGSLYHQDTTITPVHDAEGAIVSYVSLGRDVTAELRYESDLRQSQKMETIGRLAGGIAHDFNNLLSVIIAYADVAMGELDPEGAIYDDIRNIRQSGERAASLTRQLLAFSRKQVLQPETLDLNAVIEHIRPMLARLIGEKIEMKFTLAEAPGLVRADPSQLGQVLMNLAANARDAMPDGGKLTIGTANVELDEAYASQHVSVQSGRYVMLSVADTGAGMDEGTLNRVFEPFFTTKPSGHGTGLGMATVYGIVKQSDGNIWVYSEPGRGTTFKVYLPITDGELEPRRPPADASARSGGETVLVAEDEDGVRRIAERILTSAGYRVLTAADGSEALRLAEASAEPIHLLLSDVVMPSVSGAALAERVAARHPGLKVLYMSGYTDDVIVHHGILDADTHFIGKPFNSASLRKKVREVLDG